MIARWLVGGVLVAFAWWLVRRNACRHVDEYGASLMMLQWHEGRERGWCPQCSRFTEGWPANPPQGARRPCARIATPAEVETARARLHARRRLNARMRGAA